MKRHRDQRRQPIGLQRAGTVKSEATLLLVEQSLALINQQQAHLLPQHRCYPNAGILEAARMLRPETPLHLATLRRNPQVARLIAQTRGEDLPQPNFQRYGGWKPPRSSSARSRSRRRTRLSRKSRVSLAEYLVALEELERHCIQRRQTFEQIGWSSGAWPSDHPYPASQFRPAAGAYDRYIRYLRQLTRDEMSRSALELEQLLTEHINHLLQYDLAYMQQLSTSLDTPTSGKLAHAQTRARQREK